MAKRRNAWHTPADDWGNADLICRRYFIPASLLHQFDGAVYSLTEPWNWEQFNETDLLPQTAAELWSDLLTMFQDDDCGGLMDVRQHPTIPCLLQKSADGLTWETFANIALCTTSEYDPSQAITTGEFREDPVDGSVQWSPDGGTTWIEVTPTDLTGPAVPPLEPVSGATKHLQRCLAATRSRDLINEYYRAWYGAVAVDIHETLNDFNRFLRDLNLALFRLVYGEYENLYHILAMDRAQFDTHFDAPDLDTTAKEQLLCLLYTHAVVDESGIVLFDHQAILDNLVTTLGVNPGTALMILIGYLGEEGLNAAGSSSVTDTPDSCVACAGWTECSFNGEGQRIWAESDLRPWSNLVKVNGSYNAGEDRYDGSLQGTISTTRFAGLTLEINPEEQTVTTISFTGHSSNTTNASTVNYAIYKRLDGVLTLLNSFTGTGTKTLTWTGSTVVDEIIILVRGSRVGTVTPITYVTEICVEGEGVSPFEE